MRIFQKSKHEKYIGGQHECQIQEIYHLGGGFCQKIANLFDWEMIENQIQNIDVKIQ